MTVDDSNIQIAARIVNAYWFIDISDYLHRSLNQSKQPNPFDRELDSLSPNTKQFFIKGREAIRRRWRYRNRK